MSSEVTTIFVDLIARDKATKTLAKSALAFGAIGFAATKFAKESVKAFSDAQEAQDRLEYAYAKFPKVADVSLKSLDDLSKATQRKTIFDDESTKSAEALLAKFDLTGTQIEKLIPLVQDYAASQGIDLVSATESVGKAFEGNARALKAVGINFKATGDRAKDFATITDDLSQKVGGFAERQGKTAAGQVKILENQFNDLQETVGGALVPAMTKFVDITTVVVERFNSLPDPVKQTTVGIAGLAVALGIVVPRALVTIKAAKDLGFSFTSLRKTLVGSAGVTAAIIAVGIVLDHYATRADDARAATDAFAAEGEARFQGIYDSLNKLPDGFDRTVRGLRDVGDGFGAAFESVTRAPEILDKLGVSLADVDRLANGQQSTWDQWKHKILDAAIAAGYNNQSIENLGTRLDDLRSGAGAAADAQTATKKALDATTGSVDKQTDAYGALMAKLNEYIGRLEGGKRAQLAARQANRDALDTLKALGKQHTVTGAEADDAFGKILDAADAAANAVQGAANKNVAYRAEIVKLRDHVKKGSPLYDSLTDYINHLKAIPAAVSTQVTANFAAIGYQQAIAAGQALANAARAAGTNNGRPPPTATGGIFYTPQVRLIAEAGPEAVVPLGKAGALGTTVNVYVDGSVLTSDRDLAVAVARAIKSSGVRGTG